MGVERPHRCPCRRRQSAGGPIRRGHDALGGPSRAVSPVDGIRDNAGRRRPRAQASGTAGKWHFLGGKGPWTEADGVIHPPNEGNLHSRAFYTSSELRGLASPSSSSTPTTAKPAPARAGMILRATDANHFYVGLLPWGGQQLRANHFWATDCKVDGDGYLRSIKCGVGARRAQRNGSLVQASASRRRARQISVWVDGRAALSVTDDTYKGGASACGYGWYCFRNVTHRGRALCAADVGRAAPDPDPPLHGGLRQPEHAQRVRRAERRRAPGRRQPAGPFQGQGPHLESGPETLPAQARQRWATTATRCSARQGAADRAWSTAAGAGGQAAAGDRHLRVDRQRSHWSDPVASQVADGLARTPGQPRTLRAASSRPPTARSCDSSRRGQGGGRSSPTSSPGAPSTARPTSIRSTDGGKAGPRPSRWTGPPGTASRRGTIPGSLDLTEPTGVVHRQQGDGADPAGLQPDDVAVLVRRLPGPPGTPPPERPSPATPSR